VPVSVSSVASACRVVGCDLERIVAAVSEAGGGYGGVGSVPGVFKTFV